MTRLAIVCLSLGIAGCSLLFDPSGIVPSPSVDLGVASTDLHFSVDDLAPPPDLSVPLPDLSPDLLPADLTPPPDLSPVDLRPCTPPLFVGFYDGGSPDPLDCNTCGCTLDRFDNNAATALKFAHTLGPGWSEQNDGGLTMAVTGGAVNSGDLFQGAGHAYLDGDFDLQLDYLIESWTVGGNLILYVIGPSIDGDGGVPYDPFGYTQLLQPSSVTYTVLYADDRFDEIIGSPLSGTMRIRRTGNTLCASVGQTEECHTGTSSARGYIQLYALTNSAACGPACNFRARVSNLRLAHGSVVSTP